MNAVTSTVFAKDEFFPSGDLIPVVLTEEERNAILLASFSANMFALALPIMTLQVYNRILVSGSESTLAVLAAGVVIAVLMEWILRFSRSYLMGVAGARFEMRVSEEALQRILTADLREAEQHEAGEYLEGLSAIKRMRDFYAGNLMSAMVDLPFMMIYLLLIAYLAGWMVLVPLVLLMLFSVAVWMMGKHIRRLVQLREEGDSHRYNHVIEMLMGLHSVKALGLEARMQRQYETRLVDSAHREYALSSTGGVSAMLGSLFSQIMMIAVVVAGAPLVIQSSISMGTLIACLLLAGRLTQPLMRALSLWAHFQEVRLARQQLGVIFDLPARNLEEGNFAGPAAPARASSRARKNKTQAGAAELKQVAFRYRENAHWALADISLEIEPGQAVMVSGSDAVGKTALLELLAGMYLPDKGEVLVDGLPIAHYADYVRARHVAYVPAEAMIFRGTILENLCQFQPEFENAARELAEWMGVTRDIAKLPMGYETPLSPSGQGDEISPGLRQRIAIVRALAPHPRLLLLNHADRALDRDGYNRLFEVLGMLKGTASMVIVTEDQNIAGLADRKIVIHQGSIIGAVKPNTRTNVTFS